MIAPCPGGQPRLLADGIEHLGRAPRELGRHLGQEQRPAAVALDDDAIHARAESVEIDERDGPAPAPTRRSRIAGSSTAVTGRKRGSPSAASTVAATTASRRGRTGSGRPMQPRRAPSSVRVTKTAVGSARARRTSRALGRASTRSACPTATARVGPGEVEQWFMQLGPDDRRRCRPRATTVDGRA